MIANSITIWKISGANKLAENRAEIVLGSYINPTATAKLTMDPERQFLHIDRSRAIASLLFSGLFSEDKEGSPEARVAAEVELISSERRAKIKGGVFLVIEAQEEIADIKMQHRKDTLDFAVCIDAVDGNELRSTFRPLVDAALAAIATSLEQNVDRQIEKLGSVTYLTGTGAGKPVYPFSIKLGAPRISVANLLSEEVVLKAGTRISTLMLDRAARRSLSLISTSIDRETEPLQAFISAWSALEIFINSQFKERYEARWFELLENGTPESGRGVIERLKEVMRDKYRLTDKFLIIAAVLRSDSAEADLTDFRRFKSTRDGLFHSFAIPDRLPTDQIQRQFFNYLKAHLDYLE